MVSGQVCSLVAGGVRNIT